MTEERQNDIITRLNEYIERNKVPVKSKVLQDKKINVRVPGDLLKTLEKGSYKNNRSLSHTIRGFLYLAEIDNLYDLKEWLLNTDDSRDFNDIIKENKEVE